MRFEGSSSMSVRNGLLAALTLAACGIASAHHSLAGQFDINKTVNDRRRRVQGATG